MIKQIIEGITRWQGFVSLLLTIQNIIMLDVIYNKVECSAFSFTREITESGPLKTPGASFVTM